MPANGSPHLALIAKPRQHERCVRQQQARGVGRHGQWEVAAPRWPLARGSCCVEAAAHGRQHTRQRYVAQPQDSIALQEGTWLTCWRLDLLSWASYVCKLEAPSSRLNCCGTQKPLTFALKWDSAGTSNTMGRGCCDEPPVATCTACSGYHRRNGRRCMPQALVSAVGKRCAWSGAHQGQRRTSTMTDEECDSRGWMKTQNTS
jgi:hypothetical protein